MNSRKLATCDPIVRKSLEYLDQFYRTRGIPSIRHAPAIYMLDRFGSTLSEQFLDLCNEDLTPSLAGKVIVDRPYILYYIYKLYLRNSDPPHEDSEPLELLIHQQRQEQQNNGLILNDHPHQLRALVNIAPEREVTQDALKFYFDEINPPKDTNRLPTGSDLAGALALMEYDYQRYEDKSKHVLQRLDGHDINKFKEDSEKGRPIHQNPINILEACKKHREYQLAEEVEQILVEQVKKDCKSLLERIEKNGLEEGLKSESRSPDDFFREVISWSRIIEALTAVGLGYSQSGFQVEWKKQLSEQNFNQSRPNLLATLPATKIEERKREILEEMRDMVEDVDDELRICALRIDMLHEHIIDLAENEDVEVKILTNKQRSQGERRKMATAVMNELVRRTGGAVREDALVHSRALIIDDRRLLVTSADITRDQLIDEFNMGISTRDPGVIEDSIEYFDKMYDNAETRDVR